MEAFEAVRTNRLSLCRAVDIYGISKSTINDHIINPSFAFYIYIYVTFIFQPEGSFKVHLQFVHSSVLRVYIYV